jgi:predicted Zn-dependent peptidase
VTAEIHVDQVDGVPMLWTAAPPPFTMSLVFRVGQADERLQTAGITHLVEHLAFPHDHADGVANNGSTDLTSTRFFAWGDAGEAAAFLHRVSHTLSHLPLDRLDQQRDIIATEESRWVVTPGGELLIGRYGAQAHGLPGFRQLGLRTVTGDQVKGWAARYFTADNAVICMTGPPPASVGLELRSGPRRPAPVADPIAGPYPRWIARSQPFVAIGVVAGHDAAFGAASRMLERRLFDRLRTQKGLSYAVQSDTKIIDGTTLHRMFVADCLEDAAVAVTDEVIAIAYELADAGPTAEEMTEDLHRLERQLDSEVHAAVAWMLYGAECYLNGIEVEEFDMYVERRRSLTRAEIRESWAAALETMILCVPPWVEVHDPRFSTPQWPPPVSGRTYHPPGLARFRGGTRAIVSGEGVSLVWQDGSHATIRFAAARALLRSGPTRRWIIGDDGSEIFLDGTAYASGQELIAAVERAVPAQRWLTLD